MYISTYILLSKSYIHCISIPQPINRYPSQIPHPGTGKTTLAHILATHCGYRPREINSSDDRTHDILKEAIISAMTANTIYGEKRPNCIILDEIDGIDNTATIDMIVNIINTPYVASSTGTSAASAAQSAQSALNMVGGGKGGGGGGGGGVAKRGTGKGAGTPLNRPIICICNDHQVCIIATYNMHIYIHLIYTYELQQYFSYICTFLYIILIYTCIHSLIHIYAHIQAPVLKALKRIAKVFIFRPPTQQRLLQRLQSICHSEGLIINSTVLSDLCSMAGNDIRSVINTLQFAASSAHQHHQQQQQQGQGGSVVGSGSGRGNGDVEDTLMRMMAQGLSDKSKDAFAVWKRVFHIHSIDMQRQNLKKQLLQRYQKQLDSTNTHHTIPDTTTDDASPSPAQTNTYEEIALMISNSGSDESLILNGIHENLLPPSPTLQQSQMQTQQGYQKQAVTAPQGALAVDADMARTALAFEWLSYADHVDSFARYVYVY